MTLIFPIHTTYSNHLIFHYVSTLKHLGKKTGLHPHGVRCGISAARFLEIRVRIPPGTWTSVSFECCVLSGRSLYVVQRSPTECGVSECDRETSIMRRPWPIRGCWAKKKKKLANNRRPLLMNFYEHRPQI